MKTTWTAQQTPNANDILLNLEIEIEELEPITAPEPVGKLAVNHNETFVCDENVEIGA